MFCKKNTIQSSGFCIPVAILASQVNARLNGVTIATSSDDLVGAACSDCDVVLVGDMLYDEEFADKLFSWLTRLAGEGKLVCFSKRIAEPELQISCCQTFLV